MRLLPSFAQTVEQSAAQLLGLIYQERQHHEHGKHDRQMLRVMAVIVLKGVALVFQGMEGLVCDFPAGATSSHEVKDIPSHPQVGDPAAVLALVVAHRPGRDKIDPHLRVRRLEGDIIEQAKSMDQPCGAVVPFIRGHAPGVLRGLALLEQRGMIACFDTQDVVQTVARAGSRHGEHSN